MKSGIRIFAVAGGVADKSGKVLAVGVIGRGDIMEGVCSFHIRKDGFDSTSGIIKAVRKSRFREQIKMIALNGNVLAGLNVVDTSMLCKTLSLPILSFTRKRPRKSMLLKALRSVRLYAERKDRLESSYSESKLIKSSGFYVRCTGTSELSSQIADSAANMLRMAHIIARGVTSGESKGRM